MTISPERRVAILVLVIVILAIVLMWRGHYVVIAPADDATRFPGRLALLFIVALFVERAVEVVLTPWRGKTSEKLELERDLAAATARPAKSAQLLEYKLDTQRIAFWLGTALGVAFAACGFRALEWFLEGTPVSAPGFRPSQAEVLAVLDVLVTGMVIAGGADGIHKIAALLGEFVEQTKARVTDSAPPPAEVPRI